MEINIKITHADIVGADTNKLLAFVYTLQTFAKAQKNEQAPTEVVEKVVQEEPKPIQADVQKINRDRLLDEIKQVSVQDKSKTPLIKELLKNYSTKKISDLPDEQLVEFCEAVKNL